MSEFPPNRDVLIHAIGGMVGWEMPDDNFVGIYRLRRVIGEGSYGTVYLADRERVEGNFAVKVSRADFKDVFEKEGRHHAMVTGERHVIPLIEYGSGQDQYGTKQYLVTPYREGGSLRDYLKFGALPLGQVVSFANQIAAGVDNVHKHGIVHGDITAANAYFTSLQRDSLELGDFGLSEELANGDTGQPSRYNQPQRDILNLALTTAAMLQGGKMFDISNLKLQRVLKNQKLFTEYAQKRVRKTRFRGRGALVEPLLKAVSSQHEEHYPTASAFADDLTGRYNEVINEGPDRGRTFFVVRRRINEVRHRINSL